MNALNQFETPEIIEAYRMYTASFAEFADYAQEAADRAESHRGFDVGSVGIAILPGTPELTIVHGANNKINHITQANAGLSFEEDGTDEIDDELEHLGDIHEEYGVPSVVDKNCAEMDVTIKAGESFPGQSPHFIAFIVAASTDLQEIRDVTNLDTRTLPPCTECVPILLNNESTSRSTHYVSTGFSPNSEFEIRTARRLRELYRTGGDSFSTSVPHLSGDIGMRAVEMFDSRLKNTRITSSRPSRIISAISRASLIEAGRRV